MSPDEIYVERRVDAPLEAIWDRTQDPDTHERWDLRFSDIEYAVGATDSSGDGSADAEPGERGNGEESRDFTYRTRIGFGLAVVGTGEFVATNEDRTETTSVLAFRSDDPKSLIAAGRGFWRYVETGDGLRFLTEYNYDPRWGHIGALVDRFAFRPLLGWATAYSFDVLGRWVEDGTPPETSYRIAVAHALARVSLALIWVYQGLVPKLLVGHPRETAAMETLGLGGMAAEAVLVLGVAEVALGLALIVAWRSRWLAILGGLLALPLVGSSIVMTPALALDPINPVVTAVGMVGLGALAAILVPDVPTARACLRAPSNT